MARSLLIVLVLLTGCSQLPVYERPETAAPAVWSQAQAGTTITPDWWRTFGSAELDGLMNEALAANHDLKASVARIDQSRAALKAARGSLYPGVGLSASTSHVQPDGRISEDFSNSYRGGAGISYELDLFGAVASSVASGQARLQSSIYNNEAVRLVLAGDVAQTYFALVNATNRLSIADDNLRLARNILSMVEARFAAGADSALEVSQQKAAVETAEASRASLDADRRVFETALAVLLGRAPQTDLVAASSLSALTIPSIEAGVPSSLLEQRPDIREAEAGLVAANADIGVARAALYPSVTLGLDWTVAASGFGDPATTALALASSLSAPIFQGGRLEAGVEQATARQAELIEAYRQTVLTAFKEVEDALANIKAAQLREASLAAAREAAQVSYDLSEARYKAGTIDFQTLLNTQSQLFQARDSYLQTRNERLNAAVTLYKALGGGLTAGKN